MYGPLRQRCVCLGTDLPAGTYALSVGDGADDYSACFVMDDLLYQDQSMVSEGGISLKVMIRGPLLLGTGSISSYTT